MCRGPLLTGSFACGRMSTAGNSTPATSPFFIRSRIMPTKTASAFRASAYSPKRRSFRGIPSCESCGASKRCASLSEREAVGQNTVANARSSSCYCQTCAKLILGESEPMLQVATLQEATLLFCAKPRSQAGRTQGRTEVETKVASYAAITLHLNQSSLTPRTCGARYGKEFSAQEGRKPKSGRDPLPTTTKKLPVCQQSVNDTDGRVLESADHTVTIDNFGRHLSAQGSAGVLV